MANGYDNAFVRGNLRPGFPNNHFGEMFDTRDRNTEYFPGQAFASATGGIPMPGGALGGMINQMLVNPWLTSKGISIPSINGHEGSTFDFVQAQLRNSAKSGNRSYIEGRMTGMGYPGLSGTDAGKSGLAVQLSEMFDVSYGGSQTKATDLLASRMSYMQRGTADQNYMQATNFALALREGVTTTDREGKTGYNYKKSYGFDVSEMSENLLSGLKYGNTGMNREDFVGIDATTSEGKAKLAQMSKGQNEKIRMGKQTFGSDMSADQINKLMDAAMGGMAGITPEKATEFLSKIQTTSRALNINSKAFTEYVAMQQNLYKQMGIGGVSASTSIMTSAITGDVVSQMARREEQRDEKGNITRAAGAGGMMANSDISRSASARNTAKHQGSSLLNNARAAAAIYDMMTPAQQALSGVGGQLTQLETLISEGKSPEAQALISKIGKQQGFSNLYSLGANMNEDLAGRAAKHIELQGRGDAETYRRKHISKIMSGFSNADLVAAGGKDALAKSIAGVEFDDPETVAKAIMAGSPNMDIKTAERMAGTLVSNSENRLGKSGDVAGGKERLMVSSTVGKKALADAAKKNELSDIKNRLANDRIGGMARKLGVQDMAAFMTSFVAAGGIAGGEGAFQIALDAAKKTTITMTGDMAVGAKKMNEQLAADADRIQAAGDKAVGKIAKKKAMKEEEDTINKEREAQGLKPESEEDKAVRKKAEEDKKNEMAEADKQLGENVAEIKKAIIAFFAWMMGTPTAPPAPTPR